MLIWTGTGRLFKMKLTALHFYHNKVDAQDKVDLTKQWISLNDIHLSGSSCSLSMLSMSDSSSVRQMPLTDASSGSDSLSLAKSDVTDSNKITPDQFNCT